jgi:hypothetical protein
VLVLVVLVVSDAEGADADAVCCFLSNSSSAATPFAYFRSAFFSYYLREGREEIRRGEQRW